MAECIVDITRSGSDERYHAPKVVGELVRCRDCVHFGRCPMRKGDGSGYCWQAKRREARHGDEG